jgi:hypothetical protein
MIFSNKQSQAHRLLVYVQCLDIHFKSILERIFAQNRTFYVFFHNLLCDKSVILLTEKSVTPLTNFLHDEKRETRLVDLTKNQRKNIPKVFRFRPFYKGIWSYNPKISYSKFLDHKSPTRTIVLRQIWTIGPFFYRKDVNLLSNHFSTNT